MSTKIICITRSCTRILFHTQFNCFLQCNSQLFNTFYRQNISFIISKIVCTNILYSYEYDNVLLLHVVDTINV